jgi:hypothetical protein
MAAPIQAAARSDPSAALFKDVTLSAPIAASQQSYPSARARNVDLEGAGYEEFEYFVSGKANVYDWNQDGTKPVVLIEGGLVQVVFLSAARTIRKQSMAGCSSSCSTPGQVTM